VKNRRHGKGLHKAKNGEVYDGDWEEDMRTGKGLFTFRNGDYYIGEWLKNQRSGFGTVISAKGDTIVHGYWKNDAYDRKASKGLTKSKNPKVPLQADLISKEGQEEEE
jgi:hypothetical protein